MGAKGRRKPFGQQVAEAPVVVDGSGSALHRSSKPSFHEWKLFMVKPLFLAVEFAMQRIDFHGILVATTNFGLTQICRLTTIVCFRFLFLGFGLSVV